MVQYAHAINYYSLMVIPLGIVLYLAIRFGSDFSISHRPVAINNENTSSIIEQVDAKDLLGPIWSARTKNDRTFILKGLPLRIVELAQGKAMLAYYKCLLSCNNIMVHGDMLSFGDDCTYSNFAARKVYDEFIEDGSGILKKSDDTARFLERNHIIAFDNLCIGSLRRRSRKNSARVFVFGFGQKRKLDSSQLLFSPGNGIIAFLLANNLAVVENC